MKGAHKDIDIKGNVQNNRYNDTVTQRKWSTETNEIDNQFLRDYDNMCRQMEDRQIDEYYKAQRQIYSAMMGDTPEKTVYNRQYIDNISAYDSEVQRISKSVHHKLDLGPISLLQTNNSKHFPIDQYLHDRMTPATLSPTPLACDKPIHPTEMPHITTCTELSVDNTNKPTSDDKYPWLESDDIRRNMTDSEIL